MLLWYRPEDSTLPRSAYYVDLSTGASDLGGSVAAALASASVLFQNQNQTDYAGQLLDKAKEVGGVGCGLWWGVVWWGQLGAPSGQAGGPIGHPPTHPPPCCQVYDFAKTTNPTGGYGKQTDGDFNLTVLYNSSTSLDDLAWAAAWLYTATKQDTYLSDVYDFYVKHLSDEAAIADWK